MEVHWFPAKSIAEILLPYLKVKKQQAITLLKFFDGFVNMSKNKKEKSREIERREEIYQEMVKLNSDKYNKEK